MGSVTQRAKFTLPSLSVSYKLQASRVLAPDTLISSQFQVTCRVRGKPARSTQNWVRSFCPGSSLAPAVSGVHVRAACTEEDENTAIPKANSAAMTITTVNRDSDFVNPLNKPAVNSKNDENIKTLLFLC